MTNAEIVDKLRQTYPGMSKSVYSMGRNPDRYGVVLTDLAQKIAGLKARKIDARRKPYRITFRLTESDFEQFELARGADTRQTFAENIIRTTLGLN